MPQHLLRRRSAALRSLVLLSLVAGAVAPTLASAQGETPTSAASLTPPTVEVQPPLVHPLSDDEARALGQVEVTVVVEVDEVGQVVAAVLDDAASHPHPELRRAAMAVAAATSFHSALRDGRPERVRVPMTLTFTPPPAPEPPQEVEPVVEAPLAAPPAAAEVEPGEHAEVSTALPTPSAAEVDDPVAGDPFAVPEPPSTWGVSAVGQTLLVAGGLLSGTSLLVAVFSGVTALDNAARLEELAGDDEQQLSEAALGRGYGTWMVVPVAGPFAAAFLSPDATTLLLTLAVGVGQVIGLLAAGAGVALWTYGALFVE